MTNLHAEDTGIPKRLRWVTWAIPLILILYFVGGLATRRFGEVYPVFHWGLFASVSEERRGYEIWVVEQDGRRFDPPVMFQRLPEYEQLMAASYDIYRTPRVIRYFASALEDGRAARAEELRQVFEYNFLPGDKVHYRVVRVDYNALERYNTGRIESSEVIGEFSKEQYVARR